MPKHYRCAILLNPSMPFAPSPPAPSDYHIAAAYQWFEIPELQVISNGKLAEGEGVAVPPFATGDLISFLILDFKNRLQVSSEQPKIRIEFTRIDTGEGASSPFSAAIDYFTALERVKYGGKSGFKAWHTPQAHAVANSGRYAFTVDMDGDTDFYLDPEMDIGS